MTDWVNLAATGGLIMATGGLVYYTRQLVTEARESRTEAIKTREEMEESRHLSVRPLLAFDVMLLGGKVGMLLIRNVGNGPALDVDLKLTFDDEEDESRSWAEPSIVPGESHELRLPTRPLHDIRALTKHPLVLHVEGSMRNVDGRNVPVNKDFDIAAWWQKIETAQERVGGRRKLPGVDPSSWGVVKDSSPSTEQP
jgi:hypothetical protein